MTAPTQADAVHEEIVILGKIIEPYGLRGAVKVYPFADDPLTWSKLPHWWLGKEEQPAAEWQKTSLLKCKAHGSGTVLIAELTSLPDRNAAEAAQGLFVGVPRSFLPKTAPNEFYWTDLIGLHVFNTHDEFLGVVLDLIKAPANDVLRVVFVEHSAEHSIENSVEKSVAKDQQQNVERLLPFVGAVVLDVDLLAGKIRVDWGLDW